MQNRILFNKLFRYFPLLITSYYLAVSVIWIILTDYYLFRYIQDPFVLVEMQIFKGWLFIVITSILLYAAVRFAQNIIRIITNSLTESEYKYRILMEQAPYGILVGDENFNLIDVNNSACEMFGYTREELLKMNLKDLFSAEEERKNPLKIAQLHEEKLIRSERVYKRKNGELFHGSVIAKLMENGNIQAIIQDITENVNLQQMLTRSQEQYKLLFSENPHPMWVYNINTLQFLAVNNTAVRVYGYTKEEFLTMTIRNIRPQEDIELLMDNINTTSGLNQQSGPWRHRKKDGTVFYVEITSNEIMFEGHLSRFVLAQDITERKQAVDAIIESEIKYKSLFNRTPISIWEMDFSIIKGHIDLLKKTGVVNFREYLAQYPEEIPNSFAMIKILSINEASLEMYEAKSTEELIENFPNIIDESSYNAQKELLITIAEGKQRYEIETEAKTIKGKKLYLFLRGAVSEGYEDSYARVLISVIDITENKLTEIQLKQEQGKFHSFMSNLPGIAFIKDLEGRYIYVNQGWRDILGGPLTDYIGKTDLEIWPADMAQEYIQNDNVVKDTGEVIYVIEKTIKNSEIRYQLISKFPISDDNFQIRAIGAIGIDITEQKEAEAEIRKLNEELEERVKQRTSQLEEANSELEAFSYSVSHDLRAPLRAITGFSRMLLEDYSASLENEAVNLLHMILKDTEKMDRLIIDLLNFSKLQKKDLVRNNVNMNILVSTVLNEFLNIIENRKISVKTENLPDCYGDESMLRQVWMNLIQNAIKFTQKKEEAEIYIGGYINDNYSYYFIRDNGAGFNIKYAVKLFGVFKRLHSENEFEGSGVGLALVKKIINKHGGEVWGKGEPDKGAEFTFKIPQKLQS